jgi:serine/threonine protein kinase
VSAGRVDGRSDLYAVGCILFEALCGRPPFVGGIEVIAAQVRDAPPHVRSLRSEIPEALDRLVAKLLEKDPAQRLQSCHDLVTALASLTSVPAIEPSDRRRRGRRSPVAIGVGLGALIAAAGAGYAASRVLDARTVDEPLDASPARRTSDAPGLGHVSPPGHDAVTVPDLPAPPTRTDSPKASKRPAPKHDEDVGEIGENDVVGEKAKRDYAVSYTTLQKLCMTTSSWLDTYAQCPGVPTSQSSDLRRQLDAVISGLPNLPSEDWDLTAEHCEAWTATMLEVLRLAHCLE